MNPSGAAHFGLSLPNLANNRPVNRPDVGTSKMLPFMNNQMASTAGISASFGPRLYPESGSVGMGASNMGVGSLGGAGISSSNVGFVNGQNGPLPHISSGNFSQIHLIGQPTNICVNFF